MIGHQESVCTVQPFPLTLGLFKILRGVKDLWNSPTRSFLCEHLNLKLLENIYRSKDERSLHKVSHEWLSPVIFAFNIFSGVVWFNNRLEEIAIIMKYFAFNSISLRLDVLNAASGKTFS